ncbi:MAG TPA: cytochrome c-type biogenesis protein CcmH [Solirubrobacteraceae bacterium]|nr:cytochrome c-type biogenesis protein CcmH [Solirubrobacteraceae bacterium]
MAILVVLALAALVMAAPVAAAPGRGLTVTELEPNYMCTVCHEPLNASQSPEAAQERAVIGSLIAQGDTAAQIETAMVAQYGPAVLAVPSASGFNAVLYILPPVVLLAALGSLAVLLPRWRRRGRAAEALAVPGASALDSADAERLEEELARYDG